MSADPRVRVGVAALVLFGDDLLMIRRGPDASHGALCWSVPGGWLDHGETPEEAVAREVLEETGLEVRVRQGPVDVVANTYEDEGWHVACAFYQADLADVLVHSPVNLEPEKHLEVGWVWRGAVGSIAPVFPPLRTLLERGWRP